MMNYLIILVLLISDSAIAILPSKEITALADFYNATGGPYWVNNSGWLSGSDPCGSWVGVNCTHGNDSHVTMQVRQIRPLFAFHVQLLTICSPFVSLLGTRLKLPQHNLSASSSSSLRLAFEALSRLPFLSNLDLSNHLNTGADFLSACPGLPTPYDNVLAGALPDTVCGVGNGSLKVMDLTCVSLTGTLPDCLDGHSMPHLSTMGLSFNEIYGSIPASICSMRSLEDVWMRGNRLNSSIPSCIGNCSRLHHLDLSNDNGDWQKNGNRQTFWGTIPREMCSLEKLIAFWVQYTGNIEGGKFINSSIIVIVDYSSFWTARCALLVFIA